MDLNGRVVPRSLRLRECDGTTLLFKMKSGQSPQNTSTKSETLRNKEKNITINPEIAKGFAFSQNKNYVRY